MNIQNIPAEIISGNWCNAVITGTKENGHQDKTPLIEGSANYWKGASHVRGEENKTTTFEKALDNYTKKRIIGDKCSIDKAKGQQITAIWRAMYPDEKYICIDIDNIDQSPERKEYAENLIKSLATYSEVSTSGNGVHIIVKGYVPDGIKNKTNSIKGLPEAEEFELIYANWWLSFTGDLYSVDGTEYHTIREISGDPEAKAIIDDLFSLTTANQKYKYDTFKHQIIKADTDSDKPTSNTVNLKFDRLTEEEAEQDRALKDVLFESELELNRRLQYDEKLEQLFNIGYKVQGKRSEEDFFLARLLAKCVITNCETNDAPQYIDYLFRKSKLYQTTSSAGEAETRAEKWDRLANHQIAKVIPIAFEDLIKEKRFKKAKNDEIKAEYDSIKNEKKFLDYIQKNNFFQNYLYEIDNAESTSGKWLLYNDKEGIYTPLWEEKNAAEAVQNALQAEAEIIQNKGESVTDEKTGRHYEFYTVAKSIGNNNKVKSVMSLATGRVKILSEYLEPERYLINCNNRVVNIQNGKSLEKDKKYKFKTLIPINYYEKADPVYYDNWLSKVKEYVGEEQADLLQEICGLFLTKETVKHIFYFHGGTDSGKTTFLDIIKKVYANYADEMPTGILDIKNDDSDKTSHAKAGLKGLRLAIKDEESHDTRINNQLVKKLTSGNKVRIKGRVLFENESTFELNAKLLIATNEMPSFDTADEALQKRVLKINFINRYWDKDDPEKPEGAKEKDPNFLNDFFADDKNLETVLYWIVEGAIRFYRQGKLNIPQSVREASLNSIHGSYNFANFLYTYFDILPEDETAINNVEITAGSIAKWYNITQGREKLSPESVAHILKTEHGITSERTRSGEGILRIYKQLQAKPELYELIGM